MTYDYETIEIYPFDETFIQITCEDRGVLKELGEYFTFMAPNAKWSPKFQNRLWDGKIRLFEYTTGRLLRGLLPLVQKFAYDRKYPVLLDSGLSQDADITDELIVKFVQDLDLTVKPYFYQIEAICQAIRNSRQVLLSPTGSGKSLIIWAIVRWYLSRNLKKILIIVPTVNLVNQLTGDFCDYSPNYPVDDTVHRIFAGREKDTDKKVVISTWQSLYDMPKSYFEQFECIIGDECHLLKAASIKHIFQNAINCKYRFGLTGTLDNEECHRLVIQGLTGDIYRVTDTKTLIDSEILSKPIVKCAILKYPFEIRKKNRTLEYAEEMKFIVSYPPRNKIVSFLAKQIPADENVLVLTGYIEHINLLKVELEKTGKEVYVVSGATSASDREVVRKIAEQKNGIIILATYGVYSTGVNIKNLQHIIFATGSKSQIRTLQTIGRGLRLDGKKNKVTIWDLVDDFAYETKKLNGEIQRKNNTLLNHFFERIKIYKQSQFEYILRNINIK